MFLTSGRSEFAAELRGIQKQPKEFRFLILLPTQTGQQEPSTLDPPVTLDLACLFFHLSISRSQMYYLAFSNNG